MLNVDGKHGIVVIKENHEELLDMIAPGAVCSISMDCGIVNDTLIFKNQGKAVYSVLSDAYSFLSDEDDFVEAICKLEKELKEKYEKDKYLNVRDNLNKLDDYQYRKK